MTNTIISKSNSTTLKALCCILIVLHHYFQASGMMRGTFVSHFFVSICGYVSVAIFFFLSGYGITEAEQKAKLAWGQFLKKRICRVYVPFVVTNVLFLLLLVFLSQYHDGWITGIKQGVGIELIDSITWFVPVLLLLYIFAQLLSAIRKRCVKCIGMMVLMTVYAISGLTVFNIPFYAIVSAPAFVVGYIASIYKTETIGLFSTTRIKLLVLLSGVVGSFLFSAINMGYIVVSQHILHLSIALNNICVIIVIASLFVGHDVFWFKCNWLGNISYEVYLIHAKFFAIWTVIAGSFIPLWALIFVLPIAFVTNKVNTFILTTIK